MNPYAYPQQPVPLDPATLVHRLASRDAIPEPLLTGMAADEWRLCLKLADRHELTPALEYRLQQQRIGPSLPDSVQHHLNRRMNVAWAKTQKQIVVWKRAGPALLYAGIPVLVLKGVHFITELYDEAAERPMVDLDLLVPETELERTLSVLESAGFMLHHSVPDQGAYVCSHPRWNTSIDVHTHIYPAGHSGETMIDRVWQRAVATTLYDIPARVLSPTDQMIYAIAHGTVSHLFQPLRILPTSNGRSSDGVMRSIGMNSPPASTFSECTAPHPSPSTWHDGTLR